MSTEAVPQTEFYVGTASQLEDRGWQIHRNHHGVFARAKVPGKYHSLVLTDYSLGGGRREALLPRLNVNTLWADEKLPDRIRKEWNIGYGHLGIFRTMNLEITFLPEESSLILPFLSDLLIRIESGANDGMDAVFNVPFRNTSNTNIWTATAKDFAHQHAIATGAYNRRPMKTS